MMIFCTIGTQAPFDRFLKIVDEVAADIDEEIVAQVYRSRYVAKNIKTVDFLPPDEFQRLFSAARMIISHAGMGTIISAMQQRKPIIVFPRIAKLGEHRNEHQLATAAKMKELGYVYVANDADELRILLTKLNLKPLYKLGEFASRSMIDEICKVIG
jgi:UDP-N-acetylglucosamine transferase subunit ALG13